MAGKELKMKKLCLSVGFAVFTFVVSATPRLEVPAAGVVLGEVEAGEALSGEVAVRNVVPSKIALGLVFTILGILLLPFPFVHLGWLFE